MSTLRTVFADFYFNLTSITWVQLLDLGLVALVFYLMLTLLRRSRATVLLRGTLVLLAIFFIFTVFMPLPTFDYLLRIGLIAVLIATPVLFQAELRLGLEQLGRGVGNFGQGKVAGGVTLKPLVRAIENLSNQQVGALIVLEGADSLDYILETGVPVGAEVTSELLQTIFYEGTPLHDGAMVIRGDMVLAAGCVLPVSNRQLYTGQRRLGTRHRAAVGLSETTDALVLVVSEETGSISVARQGRLESSLDKTALREHIHTFYNPPDEEKQDVTFGHLLGRLGQWWREGTRGEERKLLSEGTLLLFSVLLALATWTFVLQQTNPISQERVEEIPLRISDIPPGTKLLEPPPEEVTAIVKASEQTVESLGPGSFQANVSLADLEPGLHRIEVTVESSVSPVQVVNVEPRVLDLQLVEVVSQTVPVEVVIQGETLLSPAFEIRSPATITPEEVLITGAEPQVEKVVAVVVELSVAGATSSIQQVEEAVPVDEDGSPVSGITVQPARIQVAVEVVRRTNARDVAISVLTQNELPPGYRLSRLSVDPSRVILLGDPGQLAQAGSTITTLPVNMSQASDNLQLQVPLDLPPGVEAIDENGQTVRSVLVNLDVEPILANVVLTRRVEILGSAGLTLTMEPAVVELLLSGPVPVLNEIQQEPDLLRVVIDAADLTDLEPGETVRLEPTVIKPPSVEIQLLPARVQVTAEE